MSELPQTDLAYTNKKKSKHLYNLLLQIPLFSDLSIAELEPIANGTTELKVPRGNIIFRRGDPCVGFHVVIYGQIKLMFVSAAGAERVVRLIGPGDGFGEALMFMQRDYIVTSQALRDSMLLHIGRDALFSQLDKNPVLARKMLAGLSRRLYTLMGDVQAYTLHTGAQRVVSYLLHCAGENIGVPFRISTSKTVIASRLNISAEHLSRILRDLHERKLIKLQGREFTILNLEGLRSYKG